MSIAQTAVAILAASAPIALNAADFQIQRFQLENGIRVVAVHAPDAPRQSTFTFLPITIANDDAKHAQWSHLIEHMAIRTTDPWGLQASGIQFNGETTHSYLRFETMAEPDHWKEAVGRHAKWLTATTFDADALRREKANIAMEEQTTASNGYTSKFALAAWNQIVRCGAKHAAVHADVAEAKVDDLQQYAAAKLQLNDLVTVATIGPQSLDEVRAELAAQIGKLKGTAREPAEDLGEVEEGKAFAGTWDLPTRHAMWWWKLPNRTPPTLAAATLVSQAIQSMFYTDVELRKMIRQAVAYAAVDEPEGPVLLVDCCLADDHQAKEIWERLKPAIAGLGENGDRHELLGWIGTMASQQVDPKPNFAVLRQQLRPEMRDNAEGVWLLSVLNFEYAWRADTKTVQRLLGQNDNPALKAILDGVIAIQPCTLNLEPATPQAPAAN